MTIQLTQKGQGQQKEMERMLDWETGGSTKRSAGYATILGTVTMLVGAVLWVTSGTDLWAALDTGDMASYLAAIEPVQGQLIVNLSVWILGTLILGVAGAMLSIVSTRRRLLAQMARVCYQTAVPLVIVSYIAMLAVVVQLAGDLSGTAVAMAEVVGWIGARGDDLATALILGAGPLLISLAGHGEWLPTWLLRWGYVTGLASLLSLIFLYIPGMASYGFIILPVGMGWMIAAGVVLLREGKTAV
jgi:hypothetical protein